MKKANRNQSSEPRELQVILEEFQNSSGNFKKFHDNLNTREQFLFKGWLEELRKTPPSL